MLKIHKIAGVVLCSASMLLMSCSSNQEEIINSAVSAAIESLIPSLEARIDEKISIEERKKEASQSEQGGEDTTTESETPSSNETESTEETEENTSAETTTEEVTTTEEETTEEANQDIVPIYKRVKTETTIYARYTRTLRAEQTVDKLGNVHSSHEVTTNTADNGKYEIFNLYEYDNKGNWISFIEYEDQELMENGIQYAAIYETYEYDENGNEISRTNMKNGEKDKFSYDEYGNLESVLLASGYSVAYLNTVDENGRLIRQKQETRVSEFEYDDRGNLVKKTYEFNGPAVDTYTYDENDVLISSCTQTDEFTLNTTYEYDDLGRIVLELKERTEVIPGEAYKTMRTEYTYEDID